MKKLLFLFMMVVAINSYSQQLHSIRFVHGGEELKPVGTKVISVEKLIYPTDRGSIDEMFGKAIQTDIETYKTIETYVTDSKFVSKDNKSLKEENEYYKINYNNDIVVFLGGSKTITFFNDLRSLLIKQKRDKAVIELFTYY